MGTGGLQNMLIHQRGKKCFAAQKKKEKEKTTKSLTITSFFSPAATLHAPSTPIIISPIHSSSLPLQAPTPIFPDSVQCNPNDAENPKAPSPAQPAAPNTGKVEPRDDSPHVLLTRLHNLAALLPASIPDACPDDTIWSVGSINPRQFVEAQCGPIDEDWEVLNPVMHSFFGWSDTAETLATKVRRGPHGVHGVCEVIEFFVTKCKLDFALVERKLSILEEAILLL